LFLALSEPADKKLLDVVLELDGLEELVERFKRTGLFVLRPALKQGLTLAQIHLHLHQVFLAAINFIPQQVTVFQ
jgi:hypothetical protein